MKVKGLKGLRGLKGFVAVLTAIALILSVLSVQNFSMDVYAATTPIEAIEITYKEPKVGDDIYEFIKNKGYCKSKLIVYPLEKFMMAKLETYDFSGFSMAKVDAPILKFKIMVKLHPIYNFILLKSTSKKPSPEQQK